MKTTHRERRRYGRSGPGIPVNLSFANATIETTASDISVSEVRLKRPNRLFVEPGEHINISFEASGVDAMTATVAYVGESDIGLQLLQNPLSDRELARLVATVPGWRRRYARGKRLLWQNARRLGVLAANTWLRPLIIALVRPRFVFAVYGNERDAETYFTPGLVRLMPPNLVLGFIRNQNMRGLLVASQSLENSLQEDSQKVRDYIDELHKDFPAVERIALVGRLPNFVKKAGIDIKAPLVEGSLGTRYMIWDVARQMRERPEYARYDSIVVLGGAGRIGNAVCEDLTGLYDRVIALDPRYEEETRIQTGQGTVLRTADVSHLHHEHLYIGLTHHGDVVLELYQHMPAGAMIADDTHPCISLAARERLSANGITVEKVVLSHDEFLMWPRMPAWNNRAIPGCLVEALVLLQRPDLDGSDFLSFCRQAEAMGFAGRLIRPLEE